MTLRQIHDVVKENYESEKYQNSEPDYTYQKPTFSDYTGTVIITTLLVGFAVLLLAAFMEGWLYYLLIAVSILNFCGAGYFIYKSRK